MILVSNNIPVVVLGDCPRSGSIVSKSCSSYTRISARIPGHSLGKYLLPGTIKQRQGRLMPLHLSLDLANAIFGTRQSLLVHLHFAHNRIFLEALNELAPLLASILCGYHEKLHLLQYHRRRCRPASGASNRTKSRRLPLPIACSTFFSLNHTRWSQLLSLYY